MEYSDRDVYNGATISMAIIDFIRYGSKFNRNPFKCLFESKYKSITYQSTKWLA